MLAEIPPTSGQTVPPTTVPAVAGPLLPLRILLVEDDPAISELYGLALRSQGHDVRIIANGLQVEGDVAQHAPDVIVLDVQLPGMDGLQVLTALKGDPATVGIPVLMLSNWPLEETVDRARQLGASDYALKAETTPGELGRLLSRFGTPSVSNGASATILNDLDRNEHSVALPG